MKLIDLYQEEQNLTIEDEKVWLLPTDQYSFTTFPLPEDKEGCIQVTSDEYFGLLLRRFMFTEDLKGITDYAELSF